MSDFEEDLETEGTELDIAIVTSTYKPALQWTGVHGGHNMGVLNRLKHLIALTE